MATTALLLWELIVVGAALCLRCMPDRLLLLLQRFTLKKIGGGAVKSPTASANFGALHETAWGCRS